MDVSAKHPKRVFVKRTIELEIRLSYYDRVKGTIPEVLLDTGVCPDDAPGAEYAYENSGTSSRLSPTPEADVDLDRTHSCRRCCFSPASDPLEGTDQ